MAEPHRPVSHASLAVAAFSTIVEWYDFTLYLYFATVLSRVFFGGGAQSLLVTLGGFAIAYLMRPLGAVVFGHIGDRIGRRHMLLRSVAMMTAAMLATALLPTRAEIGAAAGGLLIFLRCVMGFSVGGEYTGVVAYLLEGAPESRRGLIASSASAASEIGALLAVGVSALTVASMSEDSLQSWGWRIPFFVGAILAGSVWVARSTMQESPEFERQQSHGTVPDVPLRHALATQRGAIARSFAISALGSITYYVGITYVPAFLTSAGSFSEGSALWLSTIAAVAVILVTPFTGALSDHIGRRPVLIILSLLSAALPAAMFSLMASGGPGAALVGALVLACVAGSFSAVGAVATAEQFAGEGRVTGLALGATMATAVFGGFTPWLAQLLIERTGWAMAPGAMIALVAVAVLPIFVMMRETAPISARPTRSASS
ncbi:MFS transporter [Sphingomonas hankyongi]|uniref:MFS transporter n=1 Tax=Sphingomonas hankyongi TaxID=2908209 RepID=A0ABT0RYB2_9SPHN|nr:MFS transporter [Sphingomonas hankyongi]MCL6728572.1 MFS transporter [Sphingomonas hankyongi]